MLTPPDAMTIDRLHVIVLLGATTLVLVAERSVHLPWAQAGWFALLFGLTVTLSVVSSRSNSL